MLGLVGVFGSEAVPTGYAAAPGRVADPQLGVEAVVDAVEQRGHDRGRVVLDDSDEVVRLVDGPSPS